MNRLNLIHCVFYDYSQDEYEDYVSRGSYLVLCNKNYEELHRLHNKFVELTQINIKDTIAGSFTYAQYERLVLYLGDEFNEIYADDAVDIKSNVTKRSDIYINYSSEGLFEMWKLIIKYMDSTVIFQDIEHIQMDFYYAFNDYK